MPKKVVHMNSIDAFFEHWILVDADSDIEASEAVSDGEGKVLSERVYGLDDGMCQVEIQDVEDKSDTFVKWEVIGVYTNTDNLQPFTFEISADTPRNALLEAIAKRDSVTTVSALENDLADGMDLKGLCEAYAMRPVSIRRPDILMANKEYLHEIDKFESISD